MTKTVFSLRAEGRSVHVIQKHTNNLHCSNLCILFDELTRIFSLSWGNAFGKIQDSDGLQGPATFNPKLAVGVNYLRFVHGEFQRICIWKLNKDHYLAYVANDHRLSFE